MKTRIKLGLISLILVSLLLGVYIGYSATPSTSIWISSGIYPQATYTIWREGSNYFSKNINGEIVQDGTNATTLIQATINGASGGDSIHCLSGIYTGIGNIQLKSNISFTGSGYDYHNVYSTVFTARTGLTGSVFNLTGTSGTAGFRGYLTLKNFCINMTQATSGNGIYLKYCLRNIIENIQIRMASTYAIFLEAVEQTRIINCFFHGSTSASIYGLYASTIHIEHNEFASSASGARGILFYRCLANTVTANTFYFQRYAIEIYGETNETIISKNIVWQTARTGMYFHDVFNLVVTDNLVFDCGSDGTYYGIYLDGAFNCVLSGNIITDTGTGYQTHGIMETGLSDFNIIVACNTRGVATNGILINGTNTHCNLSWNSTTWES